MPTSIKLDVDYVRSQFPAFSSPTLSGWAFFENAGGSYACGDTIDALQTYYVETKVQPYARYPASVHAGEQMDSSHRRWAEALGVDHQEITFGPSTSMNSYVLAKALTEILVPGDEVVVTNQDHEANTGSLRRAAKAAGATIREWTVAPQTGLLDLAALSELLSNATRVVAFPHCSNIIGQENDVVQICQMIRGVGAISIVDGVSFVPHTIPDVGALGADIYLFSLYKVYSVHQGLMVIRRRVMEKLPNQAHYFNNEFEHKRMNPAGPDHAQVASAGAVLDYVERLHDHHFEVAATPDLGQVCRKVSNLWREHESRLLAPVLEFLHSHAGVRLLGPSDDSAGHAGAHRCPTVAFTAPGIHPAKVADSLIQRQIMTSSGDYYAVRVLQGLGISPDPGVVRVSWVHYTNQAEVDRLLDALAYAVA